MLRLAVVVVAVGSSGCMSTLADYAPLKLLFEPDVAHDNNPRTPTITLDGPRGDCRKLNATLNYAGQRREPTQWPPEACSLPSWSIATSADFELTDGTTHASFSTTQIEPVVGGIKYQSHPQSPQILEVRNGQRVTLDMDVPDDCLPADFEAQLASQNVERLNDGTLSFVPPPSGGGLQLHFQALCIRNCVGATCEFRGPPDDFGLSIRVN